MEDTATQSPPASKRAVRFRTHEFDAFAKELGHTSDAAKARFLGVGIATMSRIRTRKQQPGGEFIAAVFTAVNTAAPRVDPGQFFDFYGES